MNSKMVGMKKIIPAILILVIVCVCVLAGPILLDEKNAAVEEEPVAKKPVTEITQAAIEVTTKPAIDEASGAAIAADTATKAAVSETPKENTQTTTPVAITVPPANPVSGSAVIYLTFDDGPSSFTDDVLDILDSYGVKATFFVTAQHPSLLNEITDIANRGHAIGLHSYSHVYSTLYASEEAYYDDLDKMAAIVEEKTGTASAIMRFPGGSSNAVSKKYCKGIMTAVTAGVADKGYTYFDWNVASEDTAKDASVQSIINNVVNGCKKHDASVVLMHDFKKNTVKALKYIIEWGQSSGYEFRVLTPDSPTCHQKVNN